MGPKGPIVAAEGCSPLQELEKAARRAAIFLVIIIVSGGSWKEDKKLVKVLISSSIADQYFEKENFKSIFLLDHTNIFILPSS